MDPFVNDEPDITKHSGIYIFDTPIWDNRQATPPRDPELWDATTCLCIRRSLTLGQPTVDPDALFDDLPCPSSANCRSCPQILAQGLLNCPPGTSARFPMVAPNCTWRCSPFRLPTTTSRPNSHRCSPSSSSNVSTTRDRKASLRRRPRRRFCARCSEFAASGPCAPSLRGAAPETYPQRSNRRLYLNDRQVRLAPERNEEATFERATVGRISKDRLASSATLGAWP